MWSHRDHKIPIGAEGDCALEKLTCVCVRERREKEIKERMVRNTNGGGNAKKQGRKYQETGEKRRVEVAGEGEEYGYVKEMKGGSECIVKMIKGEREMRCKIGGKFRGRNKRSNYIEKGTLLIIGERSWEEGRGDVMYVYDKEEKERMREEFGIKIIDNHEEDEYGEIDESSYIEFRKGNEKEVNEEAVKKEILERVKEISIDDL